jgi:hypothetical protein
LRQNKENRESERSREKAAGEKEAVAAVSGTRMCVPRYTEVDNNKTRIQWRRGMFGNRQLQGGVAYKDVHLFSDTLKLENR